MRYRLMTPPRSDIETVSAELSRLLTHARSLTISTVMVGPPYKPLAYQAWVLDVPDALGELVSTRVLPLILGTDTGFQEIAPIPHRPEWTRRALLIPTNTSEPLVDIGQWGWASASLHLRWTQGRCGGLLLYSNEDAAHLQTLTDKGWKVSSVPAIAARVVSRPLKQGSYSGPPWIGCVAQPSSVEAVPEEPVIALASDAPPLAAAPVMMKLVPSETNILSEPAAPGLLLGATVEGQGVKLAWRALELALDGPLKRQREAVLTLTGRAFAQGMGVLAILPRPMVADGVLTPWASRLRMLDGRDLWSSAAIPWQSIERAALQNALSPIGMSRPFPDTLPQELGMLLRHIGQSDMATQGVLGLTARPGDDLAGVLSAGGGVVLLDSNDPESDLLGRLLMAACLPVARVERPLLVIRPVHLALPDVLAERAIQLVLGTSSSVLATLQAQDERWCLTHTDGTPDILLVEDLNTEPTDLDENIHTSLVTTLNGPAAETTVFQADTGEDDWYAGTPTDLRALEPVVVSDGMPNTTEPQLSVSQLSEETPVPAHEETSVSLSNPAFMDQTVEADTDWATDPTPTTDDEDWGSLTTELDAALHTDEVPDDGVAEYGAATDVTGALPTWASDDHALDDELSWPSRIDDSTVGGDLSSEGVTAELDQPVIDEVVQAPETPTNEVGELEFAPLDEWNVALDETADHTLQDGAVPLLSFEDEDLAPDAPDRLSLEESGGVPIVNPMAPDESLLLAIGAMEDDIESPVNGQGSADGFSDLIVDDNEHQLSIDDSGMAYHQAVPEADDELVALEPNGTLEAETVVAMESATHEAIDTAGGIETGSDARPSFSFAEQRSGVDRRSVVRGRDRRRRKAPIIRYRIPAPATAVTADGMELESADVLIAMETALETPDVTTAGVPAEEGVLDTAGTSSGAENLVIGTNVSLAMENAAQLHDATMSEAVDVVDAPVVAEHDIGGGMPPTEYGTLGTVDAQPDVDDLSNDSPQSLTPAADDGDAHVLDTPVTKDDSSGEEVRLHDVVLDVEPIWQAWRGGMSIPTIVRVIHEEQPHLNRGDIRTMVRELIDRLIAERLDPAVIAAVSTDTIIEPDTTQAGTAGETEHIEIEPSRSVTPMHEGLVLMDEPVDVVLDRDDRSASSNTIDPNGLELDAPEVHLSPLTDLDDLSIDLMLDEPAGAHEPSLTDEEEWTPLALDTGSGPLTLDENNADPVQPEPDLAGEHAAVESTGSTTGLTPTSSDDDIWAAWQADADITAMIVALCGYSRGLQATTTKERIYQVVTPRIVDELNAWPLVDRLVANKPALKAQTELYETLLRRMNRQQYNVGGFNHKKTHERLVRLMRAELAQRVP